jgi:hypothetical protein
LFQYKIDCEVNGINKKHITWTDDRDAYFQEVIGSVESEEYALNETFSTISAKYKVDKSIISSFQGSLKTLEGSLQGRLRCQRNGLQYGIDDLLIEIRKIVTKSALE